MSDPGSAHIRDTFEAIADCAECLVEGSVIEIIDGSSGRGVVLESRCRLCAYETRDGKLVTSRRAVQNADEARRALVEWAVSDGDDDVESFVRANFCGLELADVITKLAARKRVETSFDAVAWLFPGAGAVGGGGSPAATRSEHPPPPRSERPPAPSVRPQPAEPETTASNTDPDAELGDRPSLYGVVSNIPPPTRRSLDPTSSKPTEIVLPVHKDPARVAARALVAVMMGDGIVHHQERSAIDHALSTWGYPPMREDDLGRWRPHDLGWPEDPERLIHAMAVLTHVDGERDRSEWRIVREFARAWGFPLDRLEVLGRELEREHTSPSKRFWMDVKSVFIR